MRDRRREFLRWGGNDDSLNILLERLYKVKVHLQWEWLAYGFQPNNEVHLKSILSSGREEQIIGGESGGFSSPLLFFYSLI